MRTWKKLSPDHLFFVLMTQMHFSSNQEVKYSWTETSFFIYIYISVCMYILYMERTPPNSSYILYIYICYSVYILYAHTYIYMEKFLFLGPLHAIKHFPFIKGLYDQYQQKVDLYLT